MANKAFFNVQYVVINNKQQQKSISSAFIFDKDIHLSDIIL